MIRSDYPSVPAMKAAVELEIQACIGRVTTQGIGDLIQKVVDAERERCAAVAERFNAAGEPIAAAIRQQQ